MKDGEERKKGRNLRDMLEIPSAGLRGLLNGKYQDKVREENIPRSR